MDTETLNNVVLYMVVTVYNNEIIRNDVYLLVVYR